MSTHFGLEKHETDSISESYYIFFSIYTLFTGRARIGARDAEVTILFSLSSSHSNPHSCHTVYSVYSLE